MAERTITVAHNGKVYTGSVMKIKRTRLGTEDHGILTAYLDCRSDGGSGINIGGYGLDEPVWEGGTSYSDGGEFKGRVPTAYGFDHVLQIMKTAGVGTWEDLVGTDIIVLFEGESTWGNSAAGFAHLSDEDRVMIFKEHAEAWKSKVNA